MTPQEQQALEHFLGQLVQAPAAAKDPQADKLIQVALAKQPDAAYLLVQRAMLLEQALEQAKAQMAQLQPQAGSNGFLPRNNPWLSGAPAAAQAMQAAPAASSGVSSFLGNVATTAAGVVAGSFLFQGLEHLLHPQQHGGWMADNGFRGEETVAETTIINNYYGDSQPDPQPGSMDLVDFADDGDTPGDDSTWI